MKTLEYALIGPFTFLATMRRRMKSITKNLKPHASSVRKVRKRDRERERAQYAPFACIDEEKKPKKSLA